MKRLHILTFFVALMLLSCCLLPTEAHADAKGEYTYEISDNEVIITACDASVSGAVTIPDTLSGYPVTGIGEAAFADCYDLTSVVIPEGVTVIGDYAFYGCESLVSVNIPEGVTAIGDNAFYACENLAAINIPDSIISIGQHAFSWCVSLDFSVYDQAKYLGNEGNPYAVLVSIPDSEIEAIEIHEDTRIFADGAFSYCGSLTSVTIPQGITHIGSYAFSWCSSLTSVTIPDSVTHIGDRAFESCSSLRNITIPRSVTSIGEYAFMACRRLTAIAIPEGVTTIGNYMFYDCSRLATISLPAGLTNIEKCAFFRCSGLKQIAYAGTEDQWNRISIGSNNTELLGAVCHYEVQSIDHCLETGIYCPTCETFIIRTEKENGQHSYEDHVCTVCGVCEYDRLTLTEDTRVDLNLIKAICIDLNGHDLTGTITTNGYAVYGVDSTTTNSPKTNRRDGATVEMGLFACVDEKGDPIVPERITAVGEQRFMAIATEEGYSFHRFFVGITHMSLTPEAASFGYKTTVYGDEMVLAEVSAFTFRVQLEGYNPVYRHFDRDELTSGEPIALKIRNFDVENFSEHNLYAQVSLTLNDGTTIEAEPVSLTFRWLTEQVNENYTDYTAEQLVSFKAMLQAFDVVKKWNIPNLI